MTEDAGTAFSTPFHHHIVNPSLSTCVAVAASDLASPQMLKMAGMLAPITSSAYSTVWPLFNVRPSFLSVQILRCTSVHFPVCKCIQEYKAFLRGTVFVTPMDWKLFFFFLTCDVQISCYLLVFFQRVRSKDHICSRQCFSFYTFCSFKFWFSKKPKHCLDVRTVSAGVVGQWIHLSASPQRVRLVDQQMVQTDLARVGVTYSSHKSDQFCRTVIFFFLVL